jgi:uncharacterized Zn finger protein
MSRHGDDWRRFESKRREPPPEHGIKMKKSGTTWWGQRWIEALERLSRDYSNRLARGRTYARAGRTHDLEVTAGKVTALVTGSRPKPYAVTLTLKRLDDDTWAKAIAAMAAKAQFAAELLAGEMPGGIDEAFQAAAASLFPAGAADLSTSCSCPDWANPCKHVAATHYVLGEALDKDPFLLFELRGRTKEQVLDGLRQARGGEAAVTASAPAAPQEAGVAATRVDPAAFDAWRGGVPVFAVMIRPPAASGALLRQLGTPPGWTAPQTPEELFGPLVRAAAEKAMQIGLGGVENEDGASEVPQNSATAKGRRSKKRETSA